MRNCGKVFQLTKRGRRFERRLAERKGRAAMGEEKTIFGALSEAHSIAARTEYRLANAAFEIQSVMDDMATMKEVVNTQDVERWTKTLGRALKFLNGGK